jgi:HNH endonuclease
MGLMRFHIPQSLKREVLMEAGHRCAIPTCKQTPVELAHIIPYSKVLKHEFHNLIALCPNCHIRYDRGEIDCKSMKQYKENLSIISNRYSEFERRVLFFFADNPEKDTIQLPLSGNNDIAIMYLVRDGLIKWIGPKILIKNSAPEETGIPVQNDRIYKLTRKGRAFIEKWLSAKNVD